MISVVIYFAINTYYVFFVCFTYKSSRLGGLFLHRENADDECPCVMEFIIRP